MTVKLWSSTSLIYLSLLLVSRIHTALPFILRPFPARHLSFKATTTNNDNHADSNSDENEKENKEQRMANVRSIQKLFYTSSPSSVNSTITTEILWSNGTIHNLPVWAVPWTELPGRSNVWNVHEGRYTHMLETILHSKPPWYVGHLFSPKSVNTPDENGECTRLIDMGILSGSDVEGPAVIGTFVRIVDYRRMDDGKVLVLTQACERFVVTEIVQDVPYPIVDVQILPDWEEMSSFPDMEEPVSLTEMQAKSIRAEAVWNAFHWRPFEYEDSRLPMPKVESIHVSQVLGTELADLMPLVRYSTTVHPRELFEQQQQNRHTDNNESTEDGTTALETILLQKNIMHMPLLFEYENEDDSNDQLEEALWMEIDEYARIQNQNLASLSPAFQQLLSFLPHKRPTNDNSWKGTYILQNVTSDRISDDEYYPRYLRRKRLSYSAISLLEIRLQQQETRLRQNLLEIPTTRARLRKVIELFHRVNDQNSWQ